MALAKGTESLAVGIDAALMEQLRAFVEKRSETIREVVEAALRRHMANPPPVLELPPLPPVTVPAQHGLPPAENKKRGKK
jgi:hypothetical protein